MGKGVTERPIKMLGGVAQTDRELIRNKNTNGTMRRLPKADLPCRVCGRVIKTDDGLTHHMKNKHGDNA